MHFPVVKISEFLSIWLPVIFILATGVCRWIVKGRFSWSDLYLGIELCLAALTAVTVAMLQDPTAGTSNTVTADVVNWQYFRGHPVFSSTFVCVVCFAVVLLAHRKRYITPNILSREPGGYKNDWLDVVVLCIGCNAIGVSAIIAVEELFHVTS
jgi:hypothetical protein